MTSPQFLFAVCQIGAEKALKAELAASWPEFRPAFSRPGFLTFKLPAEHGFVDDFDLKSVFARAYGFSLGKVSGTFGEPLIKEALQLVEEREFEQLHVWQRDALAPGEHGYEPGPTPLAEEVGALLNAARPNLPLNRRARAGQLVLDVAIVEPNEWWIGYHRAASMPSRWPGGVCEILAPDESISRAYFKMQEALLWSRLPVEAGDRAVEIGSSPGGSCQALLDKGLLVTGIDPAEMDESLLAHPHFTHLRKRSAEVKRREFRGVKWLMADSNVAPAYTLDAVEAIVTHSETNVRGMLLTLKLLDWKLAAEIPAYVARVRSWGFEHVRARQLAFNRQEFCLAAMRTRSMRREAPWQVKQRRVVRRKSN
jgi:23S rRNA (cytidine2498-2'-O)-methyltransferase